LKGWWILLRKSKINGMELPILTHVRRTTLSLLEREIARELTRIHYR